jgi:hypothetical protein
LVWQGNAKADGRVGFCNPLIAGQAREVGSFTTLVMSRFCPERLVFQPERSRNMSAECGESEATGRRSERREQPLTDVGRLLVFTSELGCPRHVRVAPGRGRWGGHPERRLGASRRH